MNTDRIRATLTEEALARINAALDQIAADLPFLIDLTKEQKKTLPKFGDQSVAFVKKTQEFANQYANVLSPMISLVDFNMDVTLENQLFSVYQKTKTLEDKIKDTYLKLGAEAYSTALNIYSNLKANKNLFDGSEQVLRELGKRFKKKSKKGSITTDSI